MGLLASLASILGIEVSELLASSKRSALLWSVIVLLAFIGLMFLLLAAYLGLTLWIGPVWAAVSIGAAAILGALAVYLVARRMAAAARREAERRRSSETTALVTTAAASALPLVLKSSLMRNVGIPVGAALAALYFAHRSDSRDASHPR